MGEIAKGGDKTPEVPDDAVAEAKAKDEEDEVAAAKDAEGSVADSALKEESGADAEAGGRTRESANDTDEKSG